MFEYSDGYGHGPGVGPGVELDRERKRATFDVTAMTNLLYGGAAVRPHPHTPAPPPLLHPSLPTHRTHHPPHRCPLRLSRR